tara:strand:- start:95 stop:391 length:297 start_codon:yes stop_codon:yes gene_type:complete
MFAGSIKGVEVRLAMTSICETCRLNHVSPELYFGWVLGSINEDVIELLEQDTLSKKQERELLRFFPGIAPWGASNRNLRPIFHLAAFGQSIVGSTDDA